MKRFLFQLLILFSCNALQPPIPNIYKRDLMNKILLTSVGTSCGPLLVGFLNVFSPPKSNSNSNGIVAKDRYGDDVHVSSWVNEHPYPARSLVEGLKGDAHYLISTKDNFVESFALNAVCTHLGCVVPWNPSENKFMCPCHGSQYNEQGKVIRGPAPRSLALANVVVDQDTVSLTPWTERDFRSDEDPWWI
tara:strand:- start:3587 stop:4159 length:573 start_codon:yes stop_codon:yes gene_type:complete